MTTGALAAGAQTCEPPGCWAPPTSPGSPAVQPITSPAEFPVVVDGPPASGETKFGVLHSADGPTPFSWAALFAGASTVLLTLYVLVRNRRAFLNGQMEAEPGDLLETAQSSREQELVVQASVVHDRDFVRVDP